MKKLLGVCALLLLLAACGDFQWFPDANPNVDMTPDQFSFTNQSCGVSVNTNVVSNSVTITGINSPTTISVTGGEYSIDNGTFTTASGTITNGQSVRVQPPGGQITTANSGPIVVTLNVGGVTASFTASTDPCVTGTTP